jgi:hypothetical protein
MSVNQEQCTNCSALDEDFKLSMLSEMMKDGLSRILEVFGKDDFIFVVNGRSIKSTFAEALLISPAVYAAFRSDNTKRMFEIREEGIEANDFDLILKLIRLESFDNVEMSEDRELSFLSIFRCLKNERLSLQLLSSIHLNSRRSLYTSAKDGLHGSATSTKDCVKSNDLMENDMNLSVKYCASQFYSYSINELSRLEKNTLHALLSSQTLGIVSEDALLKTLIELGSDYYEYWQYIKVCFLSSKGISKFVERLPFDEVGIEIWEEVCHRLTNEHQHEHDDGIRDIRFVGKPTSPSPSNILKTLKRFPKVLKELKTKQWTLLYRGSDHGFKSSDFHGKCDGKSNTITIILTTKGFIFGGFTPIPWDSSSQYKPDSSGRSFLFSVKNPHDHDFGRIGLTNPQRAIYCNSSYGPTFGNGHDIYIANGCNENTSSFTRVGLGYAHNTIFDPYKVFTGEQYFTVKEIEVFTLTD